MAWVTVLSKHVHTHRASVHQAAKLVAALLRVAGVTAGLAESSGSLPLGLWLTSPAGCLLRTGISSRTLRLAIEYGLHLPFRTVSIVCLQPSLVFTAGSRLWEAFSEAVRQLWLHAILLHAWYYCALCGLRGIMRRWLIFDIGAIYTLCLRKKQDTKLLPITSRNVNRFSKFFRW